MEEDAFSQRCRTSSGQATMVRNRNAPASASARRERESARWSRGANGLSKSPGADAFQVQTVSLLRFRTRLGVVTAPQLEDVASAAAVCVGAL